MWSSKIDILNSYLLLMINLTVRYSSFCTWHLISSFHSGKLFHNLTAWFSKLSHYCCGMFYFDMLQSGFFSEQADNNRHDFQWVTEVTRVVLQKSKLSNDNRHDYEKTDNIHAIGEELVKWIWIMIENDEIWHDTHVQAEVSWNLLKSVWSYC